MTDGAGPGRIVLGVHDEDPCVTGHPPRLWPRIQAEIERRRLRDEVLGASPAEHHRRARRAFGLSEEAGCDRRGRVRLPPLVRRRGRIGRLALFVGTGAGFEIWDPQVARETGGEALRELAEYRLRERAGRQDPSPYETEEDGR
ncbi:MAG: hypothetical protein ACK40O_04520 [Allosphingosinicella sp.]